MAAEFEWQENSINNFYFHTHETLTFHPHPSVHIYGHFHAGGDFPSPDERIPENRVRVLLVLGADTTGVIRYPGPENCFISENTLPELKFGVEKSQTKERNPDKREE